MSTADFTRHDSDLFVGKDKTYSDDVQEVLFKSNFTDVLISSQLEDFSHSRLTGERFPLLAEMILMFVILLK